jgi:hypothetical protein
MPRLGEVLDRAPPRLLLEIDVGERLPVLISDDEASVRFLDGLRRRKEALSHASTSRSASSSAASEGGENIVSVL